MGKKSQLCLRVPTSGILHVLVCGAMHASIEAREGSNTVEKASLLVQCEQGVNCEPGVGAGTGLRVQGSEFRV